MPQLDTVYTSLTFLTTWLAITLITHKISLYLLSTKPKKSPLQTQKPNLPPLPWT
uniref:ATP synthase F0 subunit 8 n=1 Tax=Causus defilippii TaxID=88081 RepID=D0V5B0_CAUDE|nr:ATP synthase F0 subunit 8 [Causus defilippii]ACY09599.1 ATP synthase F0 subunit 8 [Causus defilippii]